MISLLLFHFPLLSPDLALLESLQHQRLLCDSIRFAAVISWRSCVVICWPNCAHRMRTPSDYTRNQSEFGPKMLGIRGILAFHFTQRSSAPKAVKGSKKIYEIDGWQQSHLQPVQYFWQPMIYGRRPAPTRTRMMPMVLHDGRLDYAMQQPGGMPPLPPLWRGVDQRDSGRGGEGHSWRYRPY